MTDISSNNARFSGSISNAQSSQIIERGFVYSTSPNPTLGSSKIVTGRGTGSFDTLICVNYIITFGSLYPHVLSSNTTYYVRAYAITENNTYLFGNEVNFKTLQVGQTGPGGGIVFFDKGNSVGGWRYLESAQGDLGNNVTWGCNNTFISGTEIKAGSGEENTALILAACNEEGYAAKLCSQLVQGGQSDWFLPSLCELNLMYRNLHLKNQGNFKLDNYYWSSSEGFQDFAWTLDFNDGNGFNDNDLPYYLLKSDIAYVRPIRAY